MESLYRKYRPLTFQDVVGQKHVVSTLEHAVLEGRVSHAYLFCGPRGTGKTTMARILAKALMCEEGPNKLPCGTCTQCELIASGEHPDVYELDAASRTGVDNVREEIINRVSYAPVRGAYKVYIIDEVHMLTTAAFNALLKTLEEPPEHVVFILCTTDPQKIPATILSRVQRFDFHAISPEDIEHRLAYVCEHEGFSYEPEALALIAAHARGGLRDALGILEQVSVSNDDNVTLDAVRGALGGIDAATLSNVVSAIARRDAAELFAETAALSDAGRDLLQFVRELAAHVRDVYVVAVAGPDPKLVPSSADGTATLQQEADAFGSIDCISRILAVLGDAASEMRTAPNQRLVLEIAFTRLARPESDLTLEALAERIHDLERSVEALAVPGRVYQAPAAQVSAPAPAPQPAPATVPQPAPAPAPAPMPAPEPPKAPAPRPAAPTPQPAPAPQPQAAPAPVAAPAPAAPAADRQQLDRMWQQAMDGMRAKDPARAALIAPGRAIADDGDTLTIEFPKGSSFAIRMLERTDSESIVRPVVVSVFGPRALRYVESVSAPAAPAQAPRPARQAPARPIPAPAPAPAPVPEPSAYVPADDVVPYSDADAGAYDDVPFAAAPQPAPRPAPAPVPSQPPAPAPQPAASAASAFPVADQEEERPGTPIQETDGIPQEVADMLTDVFGPGINVVIEPAADAAGA